MPRRSAASRLIHAGPVLRTERLAAPLNLSEDERALFVDIVSSKPAHHFESSDAVLLVSYCHACILERTASGHLAQQGVVTTDNATTSAWFNVWATASKQMVTIGRALKLSPMARKPYQERPAKANSSLSYYERMDQIDDHHG